MTLRSALLWFVPVALGAVWIASMLGPSATKAPPAAASEPGAPQPAAEPAPRRVPPAVPSPPLPPAAPPAPPAAAPAAATAPAPTSPPASEQEARPATPSLLFSAAFLEEDRDEVWAPEAETKIRAAFHDALVPESSVLAVQCRETLCKIDLLFDRAQHEAFAAATAKLHVDFAPEMSIDRQSAPSAVRPERLTAYLPRQGKTLKDYARER